MSGIEDGRGRGPKCRRLKGFLFRIIKQTNKNYPVGEKQTGWLDKAGQGRTGQDKAGQDKAGQDKAGQDKAGHRRHLTLGNEPTRNCKHKEIIKGANYEGNEGKQLGKMNQ